jgi:hypothetical protein
MSGIVNLQGKPYSTYSHVLNLAHERGLQSIVTDLLQVPTADNEHMAIVRATVVMKDGTTFMEYGDASPRNVNAKIATALIRMAATRAKGRALRDAVNVGEALREEIGDEEDSAPGRATQGWGGAQGSAAGSGRTRDSAPRAEGAGAVEPGANVSGAEAPKASGEAPPGVAAELTSGQAARLSACSVCGSVVPPARVEDCKARGVPVAHPRCEQKGGR